MTKLLNHINTYQSEADYKNDKSKNFPNVSYIVENDNVLFVKEKTDYSNDYLTFVALEDSTFKLTSNTVNYSLDDGQTWTALASGTASPTVTAGNKIMWKGELTPNSSNGIGKFSATANFNVQGNIMSLLFGDDFTNKTDLTGKNYAFYNLFYQNTNIKSAKNLILPATTLVDWCYASMFNGCTNLVNAPVLPATTLANSCYSRMFNGCTSLTTAPELPAERLERNCYSYMFSGCTNLVNAPVLPATTLANSCYSRMFNGCKSLTTAPVLPAETLVSGCYASMFQGCNKLTTAPELPATTLATECYSYMFSGCRSLVTAPELPVTTLADYCYNGMFEVCTNLVNAPVLPATTLANSCYYNMFRGCTSLTTAPVLPAETLVKECYEEMFTDCTSLNYIKAMFTTTPSGSSPNYYTLNWVYNVASTGTFVKNSAATWDVTGVNGIPSGWTVVTE